MTNVPVWYVAELHGALRTNSAFGLHPTMLMVNVALADAPGAMSPSTIGNAPGAVTVGVQRGPESCFSENPVICVA